MSRAGTRSLRRCGPTAGCGAAAQAPLAAFLPQALRVAELEASLSEARAEAASLRSVVAAATGGHSQREWDSAMGMEVAASSAGALTDVSAGAALGGGEFDPAADARIATLEAQNAALRAAVDGTGE